MQVVVGDIGIDLRHQLLDAAKRSAPNESRRGLQPRRRGYSRPVISGETVVALIAILVTIGGSTAK